MHLERFGRLCLLVLVAGIALIGCGDQLPPTGADDTGSDDAVLSVALETTPAYVSCGGHTSAGELLAEATYEPKKAFCHRYAGEPKVILASRELVTTGNPQALHASVDMSGDTFLLVVTVDCATDTSRVELFRDTDGDSLPEQATLGTIYSLSPAHWFAAAFDVASATLYLADGLNDRIHRLEDVTGDGIPDGSTSSVFIEDGKAGVIDLNVLKLSQPDTASVKVFQGRETDSGIPRNPSEGLAFIVAQDTDDDGEADVATETAAHFVPRTHFVGQAVAGDTSVTVYTNVAESFRVEAVDEDGETTAVLASLTTIKAMQAVPLARALLADELISLFRVSTGEHANTNQVQSSQDALIMMVASDELLPGAGETVKFIGREIDGTEMVTAVVASATHDTSWTNCTVQSWSQDELVVVVPELNLATHERVLFKIATADSEFVFGVLIKESAP